MSEIKNVIRERGYLHFDSQPGFVPDVDHPRPLTVVGEGSGLLKGSPCGFGGFAAGIYPLKIVAVTLCLHGSEYAEV